MDAQLVIATARSENVPEDWSVWTLRRDRVTRSALGWAGASLVGFLLFIPAVLSTVPDNFKQGVVSIVLTTALLLLLGVVAFGGAGIAFQDLWRLRHADEFLLVMTPDDYVKAEPRRVTHVPMACVESVTLKGIKVPERIDASAESFDSLRKNPFGSRLVQPREPKRQPTLAFLDRRTDAEVVVATDDSFDDMITLEQVLNYNALAKDHTGDCRS